MVGLMETGVPCRSPIGHPSGVGRPAAGEHLLTDFPWADVHLALASLLGLIPLPKACPCPPQVRGDAAHLAPRRGGDTAPFAIRRLPSPFLLLKPNGTM